MKTCLNGHFIKNKSRNLVHRVVDSQTDTVAWCDDMVGVLDKHLHVGHTYRLAFGVLGVLVGLLEFFDYEALGGLLERLDGLFLVQDLHAHLGGDLLDEFAKRSFLNQQVCRGLELLDHAQRHGSALETVFAFLHLCLGRSRHR